jgi:putative FmdB family regulatory protein
MPTYDFKCANGHEFEKIIPKYDSSEDPVVVDCPDCGAESYTHMPEGCRSRIKFLFNYMAPGAE